MTRLRLRSELLPDSEQAHWLSDIDELEQIAESAMGLVKEESGSANRTRIDIAALVREAAEELAAAGLPVTLGPLQGATVQAGPLSLRRALRNLLINAATHGGGAMVSVSRLGDTVLVTIDDEGPGIPQALLQQVFEPFFRGDPSRSAHKGAGLGLSIAHEIIERLGGSLTLENRPGGGLQQLVALPTVAS